MYRRADLKESGRAYADAVKEREITIFTRYVADGIIKYAEKGLVSIQFPLLEKFQNIKHSSDGILNRHDPGPIPVTYVDEVVNRLRYLFPDTDFAIEKSFLFVNWS